MGAGTPLLCIMGCEQIDEVFAWPKCLRLNISPIALPLACSRGKRNFFLGSSVKKFRCPCDKWGFDCVTTAQLKERKKRSGALKVLNSQIEREGVF